MLLRRTQIADAFIALAFGLGLLLVPDLLLDIFGAKTDAAGLIVSRLFGAALVGYAGVNWATGRAPVSDLRRYVVRAEALVDVLFLVVTAGATLAGTISVLGWPLAIFFAYLAVLRGFFSNEVVPAIASA